MEESFYTEQNLIEQELSTFSKRGEDAESVRKGMID